MLLCDKLFSWVSQLTVGVLQDVKLGITTHQELKPTNMLSVLACMTPLSDFNQSPRNMYQCQMAKQAMATPYHSYQHRCVLSLTPLTELFLLLIL